MLQFISTTCCRINATIYSIYPMYATIYFSITLLHGMCIHPNIMPIYLNFKFNRASYLLPGNPYLCQHLASSVEVPTFF